MGQYVQFRLFLLVQMLSLDVQSTVHGLQVLALRTGCITGFACRGTYSVTGTHTHCDSQWWLATSVCHSNLLHNYDILCVAEIKSNKNLTKHLGGQVVLAR